MATGNGRTNSNKLKKQHLKEKRAAERKAEEAARNTPKPKVYVLPCKVRNLSKAIKDLFEEKPVPLGKVLNNINAIKKDHPAKNFLKEILLHFADYKIDFAETSSNQYQGAVADPFQNRHYNPLTALSHLAKYPSKAIRKVKDWKPTSHNLNRQIASFARHLYAQYDVPAFMDLCWYNGDPKYHDWFIHIGQGGNIRTANGLPIALTKKEAHLYLQAPKDFSPLSAFRYGQILNLGGNEPFVRQILRTRIATTFSANDFWLSVFRWLLKHPMLDTAQYGPLVDYINNQKFVPYRWENGVAICAQPNMTMKDRDPETLIRQMEAWHRRLGKEKQKGPGEWKPSGFYPLEIVTEKTVATIKEITKLNDLIAEGRAMKHCVASYSYSCSQGRCSIWSLEVDGTKQLTIEVLNNSRQVVQARKKYNERPTASDMYYLRLWARNSGLTLSNYLL